jgi:hypothetical protein
MRTIEQIEFRDVTENGEDGFSGRFRFRLTPAGQVHTFRVSLSGTVAASAGLTRGTASEKREKAIAAMRRAAEERIKDDPRRELPTEEALQLDKRDVAAFFKA